MINPDYCEPPEPRLERRVSLNNQGAFDIALLHLLNQGHRCVSSTGRSQFRAPRGGKSAFGTLIPDRLYWNSMEGKLPVPQQRFGVSPGNRLQRKVMEGARARTAARRR
jgi:hypothetical protein